MPHSRGCDFATRARLFRRCGRARALVVGGVAGGRDRLPRSLLVFTVMMAARGDVAAVVVAGPARQREEKIPCS
jgi:hypothetical protein